jgi:hypothetical protein
MFGPSLSDLTDHFERTTPVWTINVPASCTAEEFAKDFDRAIEGLKRMRKEMFKPVKKQPRKTRRQR